MPASFWVEFLLLCGRFSQGPVSVPQSPQLQYFWILGAGQEEEAVSCKGHRPLRICMLCPFLDHIKTFSPKPPYLPSHYHSPCFHSLPMVNHRILNLSSPCPLSLQTPNPGSIQPFASSGPSHLLFRIMGKTSCWC